VKHKKYNFPASGPFFSRTFSSPVRCLAPTSAIVSTSKSLSLRCLVIRFDFPPFFHQLFYSWHRYVSSNPRHGPPVAPFMLVTLSSLDSQWPFIRILQTALSTQHPHSVQRVSSSDWSFFLSFESQLRPKVTNWCNWTFQCYRL